METIALNDSLSDIFAHIMIQFRENSLLLLEKAKLGQPMELHKPTYAIRGVKEIGNAQMIHATAYWSNQVEWKGISSSTTIQKELEDRTALCPQLRPCETAKCRRPFCLSNINECQIILDRLNHFEYRSTDAFFQDLEHLFSTLNLKKAETRQFMVCDSSYAIKYSDVSICSVFSIKCKQIARNHCIVMKRILINWLLFEVLKSRSRE